MRAALKRLIKQVEKAARAEERIRVQERRRVAQLQLQIAKERQQEQKRAVRRALAHELEIQQEQKRRARVAETQRRIQAQHDSAIANQCKAAMAALVRSVEQEAVAEHKRGAEVSKAVRALLTRVVEATVVRNEPMTLSVALTSGWLRCGSTLEVYWADATESNTGTAVAASQATRTPTPTLSPVPPPGSGSWFPASILALPDPTAVRSSAVWYGQHLPLFYPDSNTIERVSAVDARDVRCRRLREPMSSPTPQNDKRPRQQLTGTPIAVAQGYHEAGSGTVVRSACPVPSTLGPAHHQDMICALVAENKALAKSNSALHLELRRLSRLGCEVRWPSQVR